MSSVLGSLKLKCPSKTGEMTKANTHGSTQLYKIHHQLNSPTLLKRSFMRWHTAQQAQDRAMAAVHCMLRVVWLANCCICSAWAASMSAASSHGIRNPHELQSSRCALRCLAAAPATSFVLQVRLQQLVYAI
jgi:hypothetical protein